MGSVTRQRTSIALIVLSLLVMVGAIIALLQLVGSGSGAASSASKSAATATPVKLVNWQAATTPHATMSLQFAASDPSIAYLCATDGPSSTMGALPRIYKSVDGAKSWSLLASAPTLQPIADQAATLAQCAVFVDARDPQDAFFQQTQFQAIGAGYAIKRALYRSQDGGATWSQLAELDKTNGFAALAVFGSRLVAQAIPSVYGASQCGPNPGTPRPISLIDASDDGGQTWQPIGQSVAAAGYMPRAMAVAGVALFAIADKVPSGSCQTSDSDMLWRSTDGGATWTRTSLTQPSIQSISFVARADGTGYYGLAQAPSLDGTSVRALFTSDTGATWTPLPQLPTARTPTPTFTGAVTASGDAIVAVDGGGTVYRCHASAAAPHWAPYASGMSGQWQAVGTTVWSLAVSNDPNQPSQLASLPVH
jgi:photosystem II stability/assembly factor-like uncharacterized protein